MPGRHSPAQTARLWRAGSREDMVLDILRVVAWYQLLLIMNKIQIKVYRQIMN
jgi:hypothetical protein